MPSANDERLIDHVERGEWLDLTDDEDRTVSATMLRDIVRGRIAPDVDPRGLRLRGAHIKGRLDLAFVTSSVPVVLNDCQLDEGLDATDATLPLLDLNGCVLKHPDDIPLRAPGLTATELRVRNTTISAATTAMDIVGAELGDLDCWDAVIQSENGIALDAGDVRVHRKVLLGGGFTATAAARGGAVALDGAELGEIFCMHATLHNEDGPALSAENLRVHRSLTLRKVRASGAGTLGAVYLESAELGELDCTHADLRNEGGPALIVDNARVHRDILLGYSTMIGAGRGGAVSLVSAEIGLLSCYAATFHNLTGQPCWLWTFGFVRICPSARATSRATARTVPSISGMPAWVANSPCPGHDWLTAPAHTTCCTSMA